MCNQQARAARWASGTYPSAHGDHLIGGLFPAKSPTYEVCQASRRRQSVVEPLYAGDVVRFVTDGVSIGLAHRGYAPTLFVIQRLEGGKWVNRSKPITQLNLYKRIVVVVDGDPYDPRLFVERPGYMAWNDPAPLLVLTPCENRAWDEA